MGLSRERERLLGRLRRRRTRERERLFLVEGVRSVREALAGGAAVRFAVVSPRLAALREGDALRGRLAGAGVETVEVTDSEFGALSDTEAPQGVLIVCAEPAPIEDLPPGALLVVDGIQDPGNLGTLVRAAAAFAAGAVVVLDGTVDPYNAKAVRASAGAIFRVPLIRASAEQVQDRLRERGPVLVADMEGRDVAKVWPSADWALVVGSEGVGPRPSLRAVATERVAVPMPGGGESLNAGVAGSILLYVLTREGPRG